MECRQVMGIMLNGADVVGWHVYEPINFLSQLIEGRLLSRSGCKELSYMSR